MTATAFGRIGVLLLLLGATPWLMAMKCIPKDSAFFVEPIDEDSVESTGGVSDGSTDGNGDGSTDTDVIESTDADAVESTDADAVELTDADAVESTDADIVETSASDAKQTIDVKVEKKDTKPVFKPSKACKDTSVAKLLIENYSYLIECGCEEKKSKNCSIAAGMTVQWIFADGEEHNVAGNFGKSGEKISGTWSQTFKVPGDYKYDCSIHQEEMSGYKIIVK